MTPVGGRGEVLRRGTAEGAATMLREARGPAPRTDPASAGSSAGFEVVTWLGILATVAYLGVLLVALPGFDGLVVEQVRAWRATAAWQAVRWWAVWLVGLTVIAAGAGAGWMMWPVVLTGLTLAALVGWGVPWPGSARWVRQSNLARLYHE